MVSTVLCVFWSPVACYQSACGTMETSFVYFQLLKWAVHQGCLFQHRNKIYCFAMRLMPLYAIIFQSHALNNDPIRPSKACWIHQVERENNFLAGLRKDTIWLADFLKRYPFGWHRVSGYITRCSLRVPSHLTMYNWQSAHLCYIM